MTGRLPNVLVTGTPGCGKTTFAAILGHQLTALMGQAGFEGGFSHIELSRVITDLRLYTEWDDVLQCTVLDEEAVLDHLEERIARGGQIIDFHSVSMFPLRFFDAVFVLSTDTKTLFDRLTARGYEPIKIENNIQCEIFQECLLDAKEAFPAEIVFEVLNSEEPDMAKGIALAVEKLKGLMRI